MATKKNHPAGNSITLNRKAGHDFFLEERTEAGLALEGWEVKSLRNGSVQLRDAYILIRNGEAWLLGAHITPLATVSTHFTADPTRTRKLLLHRQEINRLGGLVERKGYTLIPLSMHWKKGRAKLVLALAKGKQKHDKRSSLKEKEWDREKQKLLKQVSR